VALVAPSVAGKSTLLHIAGLLESPTKAKFMVRGVSRLPPAFGLRAHFNRRRRYIGFVYHSRRLLPEFSALENVNAAAVLIRGLKRSETIKRATVIPGPISASRLASPIRPAELSAANNQLRVSIARSGRQTHQRVLFADENRPEISIRTRRFHVFTSRADACS